MKIAPGAHRPITVIADPIEETAWYDEHQPTRQQLRERQIECVTDGCSEPRVSYRTKRGREARQPFCSRHLSEQMRARWEARGPRPERIVVNGYVLIWHDGRRVAEHRVVMEQKLGRKLRPGESVHHKDGHRDNNDPANLELWIGPVRNGVRASDIACPHCGRRYAE